MKIKKRTAVAAVVALLVCIAVYLNWSYQKGTAEDVGKNQDNITSDETRLIGQVDLVNGARTRRPRRTGKSPSISRSSGSQGSRRGMRR